MVAAATGPRRPDVAAAVDRERIFVGSFNLDPRSARLNTEMGVVLESPRLAATLGAAFDGEVPRKAYEVRLAPGVVAADEIHGDADLFTRSMSGAISAMTARVATFEITDRTENWQLQFEEGVP